MAIETNQNSPILQTDLILASNFGTGFQLFLNTLAHNFVISKTLRFFAIYTDEYIQIAGIHAQAICARFFID